MYKRNLYIFILALSCSNVTSRNNETDTSNNINQNIGIIDSNDLIHNHIINKTKEIRQLFASSLDELTDSVHQISLRSDTVDGMFDKINFFHNLKVLELNSCVIINPSEFFNKLSKYTNVETLSIIYCNINFFPKDIEKLKKLKKLTMVFNTSVKGIPKEFYRMTKLKEIFFQHLVFEKEDLEKFCKFNELECLTILYGGIKKIENCNLNMEHLKILNLTSNNIDSLFYINNYNPNLREIDISDNPLGDRLIRDVAGFEKSIFYQKFKEKFPNCKFIYYHEMNCE